MVPLTTTSSSSTTSSIRKVTQTQERESHDCSSSSSSSNSSPSSIGLPSALKFAFPTKLYAMLELADGIPDFSKAITWLPHGRAFMMIDEVAFMKIVPYFFNQTHLRSFNRSLHLWGFKRVGKKKCKNQIIWYHEKFLRGVPQAIYQMVRVKVKGQAAACFKRNRGDDEPDFDGMPTLPSNTTLPSDVLSIMEEVRLHFDSMPGSSSLSRSTLASLFPATTTSINSNGYLPLCPLTRAVSDENTQAYALSPETIVNLVWSGRLNSLPIYPSPFNVPLRPNRHNNNEDWEPLPIIRDDFARFIEDTIQMV